MSTAQELPPDYYLLRGMIESLEPEHRQQALEAQAEVNEILKRGEAYALGVALAMMAAGVTTP